MKGECCLSQVADSAIKDTTVAVVVIVIVVVETKVDLKISWQFDETLDLPANLMDLLGMFMTVQYNNNL